MLQRSQHSHAIQDSQTAAQFISIVYKSITNHHNEWKLKAILSQLITQHTLLLISLKSQSIEEPSPADEETIQETEEAGSSVNEMDLGIEVPDDDDQEKGNQKKEPKEKTMEEKIANYISSTALKTEELIKALNLIHELLLISRSAFEKLPIGGKKENKNVHLALTSFKAL